MRAIAVVAVTPLVVAGLAGAIAALQGRGAEEGFLYAQRTAERLETRDVERLVKTAGEPVPGPHPPGVGANCRSFGRGELRNPWRCVVSYASGRRATYRVKIYEDGTYFGHHVGGTGNATGCCIPVPGED